MRTRSHDAVIVFVNRIPTNGVTGNELNSTILEQAVLAIFPMVGTAATGKRVGGSVGQQHDIGPSDILRCLVSPVLVITHRVTEIASHGFSQADQLNSVGGFQLSDSGNVCWFIVSDTGTRQQGVVLQQAILFEHGAVAATGRQFSIGWNRNEVSFVHVAES